MGFFDMFKKKSEPAAPAGPLVVAADARVLLFTKNEKNLHLK